MKGIAIILLGTFILTGCGNPSGDENAKEGLVNDSLNSPEPAFHDTLNQPSGMANSNVISTDTAAINIQNSIEKADSAKAK